MNALSTKTTNSNRLSIEDQRLGVTNHWQISSVAVVEWFDRDTSSSVDHPRRRSHCNDVRLYFCDATVTKTSKGEEIVGERLTILLISYSKCRIMTPVRRLGVEGESERSDGLTFLCGSEIHLHGVESAEIVVAIAKIRLILIRTK